MRSSIPRSLSSFFFVLALSGCSGGPVETTPDVEPTGTVGEALGALTVAPAAGLVTPTLGSGYDTLRQDFLPPCVTFARPVPVGNTGGRLGVMRRVETTTAEESLGFKANAKASFLMFSASASAEAARFLRSDAYSETFVYRVEMDLGGEQIDTSTRQLTANAQEASRRGRFRETCGDYVAFERSIGGAMYLVLRLDFDSTRSKSDFIAKMQGSANFGIGAVEMSAEMERHAAEFKNRATLSVEAIQLGGDPTLIGNVLSGTTVSPSSASIAKFVQCNIENIGACRSFIQSALVYASAGSQVPNSFASGVKVRPATSQIVLVPWEQVVAGTATNGIVGTIVEDARARLQQKFAGLRETKLRVDRLLISGLPLAAEHRDKLTTLESALEAATRQTTAAVKACYDDLALVTAAGAVSPTTAAVNACVAAEAKLVIPQAEQGLLDLNGQWFVDAKAAELKLGSPLMAPGRSVGGVRLAPRIIEGTMPDGVGFYRNYERGVVVWHPARGAVGIPSPIADKWRAMGATVHVGYPVNGWALRRGGAFMEFKPIAPEGNSTWIYWQKDVGAHAVRGGVFSRWAALQWEAGWLGYPKTDEIDDPQRFQGKYQQFEGGQIVYSATTPPAEMTWGLNDAWVRAGGVAALGYPRDVMGSKEGANYLFFERGFVIEGAPAWEDGRPFACTTLQATDMVRLPFGGPPLPRDVKCWGVAQWIGFR